MSLPDCFMSFYWEILTFYTLAILRRWWQCYVWDITCVILLHSATILHLLFLTRSTAMKSLKMLRILYKKSWKCEMGHKGLWTTRSDLASESHVIWGGRGAVLIKCNGVWTFVILYHCIELCTGTSLIGFENGKSWIMRSEVKNQPRQV